MWLVTAVERVKMPLGTILVLILTLLSSQAGAVQLHGVEFAPTSVVNENRLVLNGYGTRTYGFFRYKIYVAALYLEQPSVNEQEILAGKGQKQIKMRYLRKISQDDMRKGWDYYFNKSCPNEDCSTYKKQIEQFLETVGAANPDDNYEYVFSRDYVRIIVNQQLLAEINGTAFSQLLLSTWIGKHPPTEALKDGLLGRSKPD